MAYGEGASEGFARQIRRCVVQIAAGDRGHQRLIGLRGDLLSGGQGLPGHTVPAAAILQNHQYAVHMTLTSNFRMSASLAAASEGVPVRICVSFLRCGR